MTTGIKPDVEVQAELADEARRLVEHLRLAGSQEPVEKGAEALSRVGPDAQAGFDAAVRAAPPPNPQSTADQNSFRLPENIPGLATTTSAGAAAYYAMNPSPAEVAEKRRTDPTVQSLVSGPTPQSPATGFKSFDLLKPQKVSPAAAIPNKVPSGRPPQSLEDVVNSPDSLTAFEQYLQSLGFDTRPGYLGSIQNAATAVELLADPVIRTVQDELGRPLVEKYFKEVLPRTEKLQAWVKGKEAEGDSAAQELLARSVAMFAGGPAVLENMDEARKLKGINRLEETLGTTGAAAALAVSQQVGELPLFIVGPGKWIKMGRAAINPAMGPVAKTAIKSIGAALGGARAGAVTALAVPTRESELVPGMSIVEGAAGGFLLGGFFHALMGAAKRVLRPADWAVESKLAEFAREDAADALRGRLVAEARAAGEEARLRSTLDELRYEKFKLENAPKQEPKSLPEPIFNKPESKPERKPERPPAQPIRAIITKDGIQQMQVEVLSFPSRAEADMPDEAFGPVYVHHDPQLGPVIKFIQKIQEDGTPLIKTVPANITNLARARAVVFKSQFPLVATKEFLAYASNSRQGLALERAALSPTGWVDPALQRIRAKLFADKLDEVLQEAAQPPKERVQPTVAARPLAKKKSGKKVDPDLISDLEQARTAATRPTVMAGSPIESMWKRHTPLKEPSPASAPPPPPPKPQPLPKVTVQQVEDLVPWENSVYEPDGMELLVDSNGELHARPIVLGDTALPEDVPPTTGLEDMEMLFGDTAPKVEVPTGIATIEDLKKIGFDVEGAGKGGAEAAPRNEGKVGNAPASFFGQKALPEGRRLKALPEGSRLKVLPEGGSPGGGGGSPGGGGGGGGGGKKPPIGPGRAVPELPPGSENIDISSFAEREALEEAIRHVQSAIGKTSIFRKAVAAGLDTLANTFVSNHLRGPAWWAAWKTSWQATQILQRTSDEIFQFARRTFGGSVLDDADKALYRFFQNPGRTPDEVKAAWGSVDKYLPEKLKAKAKEFSFNLLAEKEMLDSKLRALGYVPDDLGQLREDGMMDLYLLRRYMVYAMPRGRYAKSLLHPQNRWRLDEGVDFIYKEMKKTDPTVTPADISQAVLDLLRESDPIGAVVTETSNKRLSALRSLLKRKDIPKPIRNLLGEIESGQAAIAMSLATQRSLVARFELLHDLHAKGPAVWSPRPVPALERTYKIPDSRAFGPMAGKYVDRNVYDGITHMPDTTKGSHDFIRKVLGFVKGNQVALGGVGPLLNSTFGNLWSGTLSGGLDFARPLKSAKAFRTAIRALIDYSKDPSGLTGSGSIIVEARRYGADFFGFGHEEVGSPEARKFLEEVEKAFPKNAELADVWGVLNTVTFKQLRKLSEKGGWLLDMNDRLFRLQSYIMLRDKFLADLARHGRKSLLYKEGLLSDPDPKGTEWVEIRNKFGDVEGYTKMVQQKADELRLISREFYTVPAEAEVRSLGRPMKTGAARKGEPLNKISDVAWARYFEDPITKKIMDAAASLAARRVNQSFWNPTFIAKPLDRLRKSALGVITPYATATFEAARINAMVVPRLLKEPDLWFRLAGAAAMVYGASRLMRHVSDVSDEEVNDALTRIPARVKGYRPFMFPLAWRDDMGRVQFWDYSRMFDPLRYFVGSGTDPMWSRVAYNLVGQLVEGGAAEDPAQELSAALGLTTQPPETKPVNVSTPRAEALLRYLLSKSLLPGAARGVYNAARLSDVDMTVPGIGSLGARQSYEPKLTPSQAAWRAAGVANVIPVDPTNKSVKLEKIGRLRKLESEMRGVLSSQLPPEEKRRRLEILRNERLRVMNAP